MSHDEVIRQRLDEIHDGRGESVLYDAAITAVVDLHQPYAEFSLLCQECTEANGVPWPCATYEAVAAALGVKA